MKTDQDLPAAAVSRPPCEDAWSEHLRNEQSNARKLAAELAPEGFHAQWLNPKAGNPREVAFLDEWRKEHEHTDLLRVLACLEPDDSPRAIGMYGFPPMKEMRTLDERDRRIVSTVIQWLGSNIGMSLLEESLHRCGMRITSRCSQEPLASGSPQAEEEL